MNKNKKYSRLLFAVFLLLISNFLQAQKVTLVKKEKRADDYYERLDF